MAEATDRNTTSNRISWDEALTRAGSSEALLSYLREVPILAWHQGLYYTSPGPSGRTKSGPGEIDPDLWAEARVDPATRRVIFLLPWTNPIAPMFAGDHGSSLMDEVFAFGIELERGVTEVRFPAHQPKPPEPERVEALAPAKPAEREMLEPLAWQAWARNEYPKERNERSIAYIRRLYGEMKKADNVTEAWEFANFRRRYFEAVKAEAVQKQRKVPRTV
jgi:hypothetical protein